MNVEPTTISPSDVAPERRFPGRLIIMSGIPGSGKTTFAKLEQAKLRAEGYKVVRVNRDDLRTEMFGDDYHDSDPVPWCERTVSKMQLKLIDHCLRDGFVVISDATNLNARDSKVYLEIAEELGLEVEHIAVVVPLEVAIERNAKRAAEGGRFVPNEVIERMWTQQRSVIASPSPRLPIDRIISV